MTSRIKGWQTRVTPKLFEYCFSEIEKYDNADEYAAALIKSPIWISEMVYKDDREAWLKTVWRAYHRPITDVVEQSGMTKASFYRYFGIPRRTFQDWIYGKSTVPVYTLFMIQEILGMVTRF